MTSVSSTTTSPLTTASTAATGGSALGKDDFLKLLTAQLSNQDPLNPMDNTQFVAQLAQFSALEQQMQANTNLEGIAIAQSAMNNAQVTQLVGKTVEAKGNGLSLQGGVPVNASYTADSAAADVTVTIRDAGGKVVRTMPLGEQSAGAHNVIWDGANDGGTKQPDGTYTIEVSAKDAGGKTVSTSTNVTGLVTAVSFTASGAQLVIGATGQKVAPADVITVKNSQ